MRIYHFCGDGFLNGIRSHGITKGEIWLFVNSPKPDGSEFWWQKRMPGWQWLTLDPEKSHQTWATQHLIKYDRTLYRFTVEIPDRFADQLYDRERLKSLYPESTALFDGWAHSDQWRVYRGNIPKYWLKELYHWNGCDFVKDW